VSSPPEGSLAAGTPDALRGIETEELVLAELVSRVLDRGVMVAGDVTISVAGVDLVHLALRLRLSSTETLRRHELARAAERERTRHELPHRTPPDR
jgi:gas vesicle structural protein